MQDSGTYSCQLMSSSAVLATSDFNIIIASKFAWDCLNGLATTYYLMLNGLDIYD